MSKVYIKQILEEAKIDSDVIVRGWVRTKRNSKNVTFINISDGTTINVIQCVVEAETISDDILSKINTGACLEVHGKLIASQGNQKVEVKVEKIVILGEADAEKYPIQPKKHSFEFLREKAHLRPRTNTFGAILRVRHARVTTLDAINPPKTEDGKVDYAQDFFGKETNLTVSGQLEGELGAMALSKIYTFGPTFRAENSNTSRHLAEFWMIEPEVAFNDLVDNMDLAEDFLKYLIKYALEKCEDDLQFLVLKNAKKKFQFPVDWGTDLQSEHERYLVEKHYKKPVILTDYPEHIKAFYMKLSEDGKTVRAMDVLFPGIGEIIGGSQREEDYEKLKARAHKFGIEEESIWWYLETRQFGTCPHAGFGLGFERLVLFVTGMSNIRDVIPFPRYPKSAEF